MNFERITSTVAAARADGRSVLLETEGLSVLSAMGFPTPRYECVRDTNQAAAVDFSRFPGDRVVVKVLSPEVLHKTEVGGVAVVLKSVEAVRASIRAMQQALAGRCVRGFIIAEHIPYDRALGGELLLGIRWTSEFGAVVVLGAGGIHTEFLGENLRPGRDVAIAAASDLDPGTAEELLGEAAVTDLVTRAQRGQEARIESSLLADAYMRFGELARTAVPEHLTELEVNPLVVHHGRLIPLDVAARCETGVQAHVDKRPLYKLKNLLKPRSIAVAGVSERLNPGHVILNNIIRAGFDRRRVYVVKPASGPIEGCVCYPDIASLPERVDLFVMSVAATEAPGLLRTIIEEQKAESIILIPGGLGEKQGTGHLVSRMQNALRQARESDWQGPLVNGANCMGIRSRPGSYDATFIPDYKQGIRHDSIYPIALISQSGAYLAAKSSKLGFDLRYAISIGNQMDLTIGDYVSYLKDDPELELIAVYAEGFRTLDGLRFLEAAREFRARGGTVILYRAGRTPEGARATASHTATIAGDYSVTRELAYDAGVVVCDSTGDFEDLVKLFALLGDKDVSGLRLGALSNAGFESVLVADSLDGFKLSEFSRETRAKLLQVLRKSRIERIVDIRNPLDITPMAGDNAFGEAARAVLNDPDVDIGFVGCVPLTPALQTLPFKAAVHDEDVYHMDSVARRLIELKDELRKPWVAAVDGGRSYDALANLLEDNGVPTFRTADRALHLLKVFCEARMKRSPGSYIRADRDE